MILSDLLTTPLNLIRTIVGEISSGGAIPFFDPFYNIVVLLWMAAIAAILVAPFWKKFRGFAAILTWAAIFTTLVMRGSSSEAREITALTSLFNISLSLVLLIVFVFLTIWIFGRLVGGRKMMPTTKVS